MLGLAVLPQTLPGDFSKHPPLTVEVSGGCESFGKTKAIAKLFGLAQSQAGKHSRMS
ncbi:MAG: hypothetical protein F6J93_36810 [Oscillatoria sp. SIO1A7]|nr:hypothetical protein [Oscillatoria sp. SIO1A7]